MRISARRRADIDARTNVGDVELDLPDASYALDVEAAVGDADVNGLDESSRARHTIEARSDVGEVDVTAR